MELIKEWAGVLGSILGTGAIVYAWLTSQSKQNADRLNDVEDMLASHERTLIKIEADLEHLPTKDMVADLNVQIMRLSGAMETLGERVSGIGRIVTLIDETLRSKDGGR